MIVTSLQQPARQQGSIPSDACDCVDRSHSLLLASDGSAAADAAVNIAALLARRDQLDVRVVLAQTPFPQVDESLSPHDVLQVQLPAFTRDGAAWSIHAQERVSSTVITTQAERSGAELIVMGLRPHTVFDRLFRNDSTLRVIRESTVPVLAVTPALTSLPRRVIAAVDFSRASLQGVRAALRIAGEGATILLVHVQPEFRSRSERDEGAAVIYSQGMRGAFARLRKELCIPAGVPLDTVVLRGDPATELLSLAERSDADLIALGMQNEGSPWRPGAASLTARLVRDGRCSLLAVPPARPAARVR